MRPVGKGKLFFSKAAAVFLLCAFDLAVLYVVSTVAQVGLGGSGGDPSPAWGPALLDPDPLAVLVLFFCLINQLVRGSSLTVLLCVVLYIGCWLWGPICPRWGAGVHRVSPVAQSLDWDCLPFFFVAAPALAFWRYGLVFGCCGYLSSLTGRKPDGKMAGRNPKVRRAPCRKKPP